MFIFLTGIAAGAFTSLKILEGGSYRASILSIMAIFTTNGTDIGSSLMCAVLNNAIWLGFMILGGIHVMLVPLLYAALLLEGFTFGFAAGSFIGSFGFGGFMLTLLCVMPPSALIALCHAKLSRMSFSHSLQRIREKGPRGALRQHLARLSRIALISVGISILQAVLFPYLIQWLSQTFIQ
jgi:hypothetical protein